jgi:predicted  nucleic acid-binding Zn-ribbon protein
MTDDETRRAMRYLLCRSCGALHLGTPAATTDLCANCGGSKFRLASIEMVTQPIPSVRWPRPFSAEEMQRRRDAVRQADADNRIEGIFRDPASNEIFAAFIRGDFELRELVPRLKTGFGLLQPVSE